MNGQPKKKRKLGFAIALAWPQTYCKQPGSWYDGLMHLIGFNKSNFYKAGHAALVLVDGDVGDCLYFDFGRYHAPYQYGRARSGETDHDLVIKTKAIFSQSISKISNLNDILYELANNSSCHGEGILYAAHTVVDFDRALAAALAIQQKGVVAYGPFVWDGTNCSRFVNTVVLAGRPPWPERLRLFFFQPFTPSPMGNVLALKNQTVAEPEKPKDASVCVPKLNKSQLINTLSAPLRPIGLPAKAQWLAGEGAGSWFHIEAGESSFRARRYSPEGKQECSGYFALGCNSSFHVNKPYRFVHLSHCQKVRIEQDGKVYVLERIASQIQL